MRLHNAARSPVLDGGVGWPSGEPGSNVLFNRGTEIHPGHGLWEVQLFLLKTGKQTEKKKKSDDVSRRITSQAEERWNWVMEESFGFEMWLRQGSTC